MATTRQTDLEETRMMQIGDRRKSGPVSLLSKDAIEAIKQENWHNHLRYALHRDYFAPVQQPAKILAINDGIGLWSLERLKEFPEAEATLLDDDPKGVVLKHFLATERAQQYYPLLGRLKGVHGSPTKPLPFADGAFNFTHMRLADSVLSEDAWPRIIREMGRVTDPDGWVEIVTGGWFWSEQGVDFIRELLEGQVRLCEAIGIAPTGSRGMSLYLHLAGVPDPYRRVHILGKTPKQRTFLIHDLGRLIRDTRDYEIQFGIHMAEQFDALMKQWESQGQKAGLLMAIHRVCFQPKSMVPVPASDSLRASSSEG